MDQYNDWETKIDGKYTLRRNYDLNEIYNHAHSELSLQQSKRDQLITVYLALCSFLIPFALGEKLIDWQMKGLIFITVGIVGVLFSMITVRYREYKEIYWLCCQSISLLFNFDVEQMDKCLVQSVFYQSLSKRGKVFLRSRMGKTVFSPKQYFIKGLFSSETLYFMVLCLMASCMVGLGLALAIMWPVVNILIAFCSGIIVFVILLRVYFSVGKKVYGILGMEPTVENKELRDKCFNRVFAKAWFLHFCYEENT